MPEGTSLLPTREVNPPFVSVCASERAARGSLPTAAVQMTVHQAVLGKQL